MFLPIRSRLDEDDVAEDFKKNENVMLWIMCTYIYYLKKFFLQNKKKNCIKINPGGHPTVLHSALVGYERGFCKDFTLFIKLNKKNKLGQ